MMMYNIIMVVVDICCVTSACKQPVTYPSLILHFFFSLQVCYLGAFTYTFSYTISQLYVS